jgi:hypothetical protein
MEDAEELSNFASVKNGSSVFHTVSEPYKVGDIAFSTS